MEKTRGFLESNASGIRGLSPFFVGNCAKFVPRILLIRSIVHNRPNSIAADMFAKCHKRTFANVPLRFDIL